MAGRDKPNGPDPDDWFTDEKPPASTPVGSRQQPGRPDDWLSAREPPDRRGPRRRASPRTLVIGAVFALLVLVVVGLAASGVFSGGGKPRASATTTVPRGTTTSTTTQPRTILLAPASTLKPGDTGTQVRVLQSVLAQLGYSPGTVDGQYGAATVRAVSNFQRAQKLTVDGIVGPATLAALKSALAARG